MDLWTEAMENHGLSIDWYVHRERGRDEVLPWGHISAGLHEDFLWQEWTDALAAAGTPDCRWTPCYDCGVCTGDGLEHVVASTVAPAGGSQGTGQDLSRGGEVPVSISARRPAAGVAVVTSKARVRFRFSKLGKIRWTSHRDLARMWERAFRRVGLPLAYSEGFSPRPRVSFGLALPTGHESVAEYLDVELTDLSGVDIDSLPSEMSAALPTGVEVARVAVIAAGTPSLQESVTSCSWRFAAAPSEGWPPWRSDDLASRIDEVLAAPALVVSVDRKGSPVEQDIRPAIIALSLVGPADDDPSLGLLLEAELAAQPRSVRPSAVLSALGPGLEERSVRRTHQWILREGARREPLAEGSTGDATDAPRALGRASSRRDPNHVRTRFLAPRVPRAPSGTRPAGRLG